MNISSPVKPRIFAPNLYTIEVPNLSPPMDSGLYTTNLPLCRATRLMCENQRSLRLLQYEKFDTPLNPLNPGKSRSAGFVSNEHSCHFWSRVCFHALYPVRPTRECLLAG